jgi:DNA-binding NarL/FixJ family response regulator
MTSTSGAARRGRAGAKVLIAGRNAAGRDAIALALERAGFRVCALCPDATSAVEEASRTRPDVCLVDIDLPGGGLTTVRAVVTQRQTTRAVVLASAARPADLFAAVRAGALGYVLTDVDADALAGEVETVLHGRAALSAGLTADLMAEFRAMNDTSARCGRRTDRRRSKR